MTNPQEPPAMPCLVSMDKVQSPLPDLAGLKRKNTCNCGMVRCTENYGVTELNAAIDACIAALANRADKKGAE